MDRLAMLGRGADSMSVRATRCTRCPGWAPPLRIALPSLRPLPPPPQDDFKRLGHFPGESQNHKPHNVFEMASNLLVLSVLSAAVIALIFTSCRAGMSLSPIDLSGFASINGVASKFVFLFPGLALCSDNPLRVVPLTPDAPLNSRLAFL